MFNHLFYSILFFIVIGSLNLSASDDLPFLGFRGKREPLQDMESNPTKCTPREQKMKFLRNAILEDDLNKINYVLFKYFEKDNENFFLDPTADNPINLAVKKSRMNIIKSLWEFQKKTPACFSHLVDEGLEQKYAKGTITFPSPLHTAAFYGEHSILDYLIQKLQEININPKLILFFDSSNCDESCLFYLGRIGYDDSPDEYPESLMSQEGQVFGCDYMDYRLMYGENSKLFFEPSKTNATKHEMTKNFIKAFDCMYIVNNPNIHNLFPLMGNIRPFDMNLIQERFLDLFYKGDYPEFCYQAFSGNTEIHISSDPVLTPLQAAVRLGCYDSVRKLIEIGAQMHPKDSSTPLLHHAINSVMGVDNRLEIFKFLIQKGANVNAVDDNGVTALNYISQDMVDEDAEQMLSLLMQNGADLNIPDKFGRYPIIYLMFTARKALFQEILNMNKVKMNYQYKEHESPIHSLLSELSYREYRHDQPFTIDVVEKFELLINHDKIDMSLRNQHKLSVAEVIANYVEEEKFYMKSNTEYKDCARDNRANRFSRGYTAPSSLLKVLADTHHEEINTIIRGMPTEQQK